MSELIPNSPRRDSRSFQKIVDAFLGGTGLPFAGVLLSERIERVFQKHGCLFGLHGVYTTAIMVWSFLSQVLRGGKEASCQAAVARVVSYCQLQGLQTPTEDTIYEGHNWIIVQKLGGGQLANQEKTNFFRALGSGPNGTVESQVASGTMFT